MLWLLINMETGRKSCSIIRFYRLSLLSRYTGVFDACYWQRVNPHLHVVAVAHERLWMWVIWRRKSKYCAANLMSSHT